MAELRRKTPSIVCMFTAGALEQGRNGWTHQRPEIGNYFSAMMRNGNIYPLFPCDANAIQAAYEYATNSFNKAMIIMASKSPLPVYLDQAGATRAVEEGAAVLHESTAGDKGTVVFAVTGDMVLLPVFEACERLEAAGYRVRIVSVVNPRRLYRPGDVSWNTVSEPDDNFMDDDRFNALFDGDVPVRRRCPCSTAMSLFDGDVPVRRRCPCSTAMSCSASAAAPAAAWSRCCCALARQRATCSPGSAARPPPRRPRSWRSTG